MPEGDAGATSGPVGFARVGSKSDFPVNVVSRIVVNGDARALSHCDPTPGGGDPSCPFYATQLHCTHVTLCELTQTGVLAGTVLTCLTKYLPGCAHGSKFDVVTGEVKNGPAISSLVVYETRCLNDEIWVAIRSIASKTR